MSTLPQDAQKVEVNGATVEFFKYEVDGVTFYQFDSSMSGHPEPMINAMSGLQVLSGNDKLVMINSKAPMGLFPKIEAEFSNNVEQLEDGKFKITFARKDSEDSSTNFTDTACSGGGCH